MINFLINGVEYTIVGLILLFLVLLCFATALGAMLVLANIKCNIKLYFKKLYRG